MCTILAATRIHPEYPLLVAANRDEFLGRPARAPYEIRPGILAGIDLEKGGSWMGSTARGLFVGLTNQHTERLLAPAPRSRGEVVVEALAAGTLDRALRYLRGLDPSLYSPFNLLLGDPSRLFVAYSWEAPRIAPVELPPGLHVLANDRLSSPLYPKTRRAEQLAAPLLRRPWTGLLQGFAALLADHQLPPSLEDLPVCDEELRPVAHELQALCVHTSHGYGTRSSSVIAIQPDGLARYAFADGAPCVAAFQQLPLPTPLPRPRGAVRSLLVRASPGMYRSLTPAGVCCSLPPDLVAPSCIASSSLPPCRCWLFPAGPPLRQSPPLHQRRASPRPPRCPAPASLRQRAPQHQRRAPLQRARPQHRPRHLHAPRAWCSSRGATAPRSKEPACARR